MKIQIEDAIPLPENWQDPMVRGNGGWVQSLRDLKIGQSFTFEVIDQKTNKEFNNLRAAIYNLQKAKFGRRNFVVRMVEKEELSEDLYRRLYRVWAAPLAIETSPKVASSKKSG